MATLDTHIVGRGPGQYRREPFKGWRTLLSISMHTFLVEHSANDTTLRDFYVRIAASDLNAESKNKGRPTCHFITAVVVVSLAFLVVLSVSLVIIRTRRSAHAADDNLMHFEYRVLKKATKNFSEKIGEGGFSSVFRGVLPDLTPIAVKKLLNQNQSHKQFLAEVRTIGTIQHVNVVRLRGFCAEESKRFLVYEYLANGSLAAHLFQKGSSTLDWKTRYRIAIGTAKGLEYLHERCRDHIIHCDIKPENILLGSELVPQIADFGLAKLLGRDVSRVITTMRGTRGYLAPEWITGGAITSKVDVFSYGKLLFEIISGKRNIEELNSDMRHYLPLQIANSIAKGEEVLSLVDRRLNGLVEMEEVCRAWEVACWCIQDSERDRPTMSQLDVLFKHLYDALMATLDTHIVSRGPCQYRQEPFKGWRMLPSIGMHTVFFSIRRKNSLLCAHRVAA
ncbi:G-type lectin S-receptor-like serine/threonine-protein kinase At2g19130 [Rhodamnia argentea]|uniref:G-type lectin S-receptor-like serine/threonine-protein kinase At2g19130 n=1 Tax=Rhodamnia argentea TaxID=178133 RepID=A0A8B8PUZ0_9MYRT|nr:G-type lectin S-receptor-like serine/threonine-protein kinase At2g19130 [Rhodamnia argentea]